MHSHRPLSSLFFYIFMYSVDENGFVENMSTYTRTYFHYTVPANGVLSFYRPKRLDQRVLKAWSSVNHAILSGKDLFRAYILRVPAITQKIPFLQNN
jgi:hypothetical protein